MDRTAHLVILVELLSTTMIGCPPEAEFGIFGGGSGEIFVALPAPPSTRCHVPGGFYESGPLDRIDLCVPAANWRGDIPCNVGRPEFIRIRFESPREACAGSIDVMASDMVLLGWLEGSGGVAEVESTFARADLEGCDEAIQVVFGGDWLCDDGTVDSTAESDNPRVSGSWSFPTPQRRQP